MKLISTYNVLFFLKKNGQNNDRELGIHNKVQFQHCVV